MASKITAAHEAVILDACCVLNLYASGKMSEIVASLTETVSVSVYVKDIEVLYVYKESKQTAPKDLERVDLQPLIEQTLIHVVDFESEAEKISFVRLASQRLDDGEAATGAIAIHRNWAIATDDRRCRAILEREVPHIPLLSTPEIIKHWADNARPVPDELGQVLEAIESRANYRLGRKNPHYQWWQTNRRA